MAWAGAGLLLSTARHWTEHLGLIPGDQRKGRNLGLSAQWTAPTGRAPFRYGGAVGPLDLDAARADDVGRAVRRVTRELGLVGLNSADFLVSDDVAWLVEVNPRPGATLDAVDALRTP